MRSVLAPMLALVFLAGCESLPHDGPSMRQVEAGVQAADAYAIVELDYRVSQLVAANPPRPLRVLAEASSRDPIDLIGEGDVLSVTIYQAGSGPLVGGDRDSPEDATRALPRMTVDRTGSITLPFAGAVKVLGLTPAQAGAAIQAALRGRVIDPQVIVSVASNLSNSVTVVGEVRNAGRFPLQPSDDRLLDMLAAAGGSARPPADLTVTVARGEQAASTTMAALLNDPAENIRLAPQDQIRVAYKPRKFSTFGAFARASQLPIEDDALTLAGAISRIGGLDSNAAAPFVLVFRFERPAVAEALGVKAAAAPGGIPVVYRLNLREPSGYFIANTFEVRDQDLIYAPRADAAELRKFFELVTTISRVAYDISVTNVVR